MNLYCVTNKDLMLKAIIMSWTQYFAFLWTFTGFILLDKGASVATDGQQGPSFLHEPPSHVDFLNNTGIIIPCSAQGSPTPLVTWSYHDGIPLRDIPGFRHVRPDGSLVFPPFQAEDFRQDVHDAVYKCVATNIVGIIGSREVHVRAVVQRRYKVQVYDEFVIRGNTAVLRCNVPAFVRDYVSFVSWKRDDGVTITSTVMRGGRYSILQSGELYIRNVNQADGQKRYSCQTRHRLNGEMVSSAISGRLFVTDSHGNSSPKITDNRPFVSVKEGDTAELACAAEAFPLPTYRWYKDEDNQMVPLLSSKRMTQLDGSLIIQFVNVKDSGKYVCVVNNSVGEEKVKTSLTVRASLSAYVYPQRQVVDVGRPATFNCTITGHPVRTILWMKDQRPLPEVGRIVLLAREVLHIATVHREDRGMYQCFVYNDMESSQSTAELKLGDVAPTLVHTFPETTVKPGASISLKCAASGNPLPQITWELDDTLVPDAVRFRVGDFVTSDAQVVSYVNISDIRVEDGGEYKCSASNAVGTVSHTSRINVYGPPVIRTMRNLTVVAGESMSIRCPVSGYPIEKVTWEKDGVTLPVNHRQTVVESEGRLVVEDIQRQADGGEYSCIASNKEQQNAKGSVLIRVLVAPQIDPQPLPEKVYTSEGLKVKLMCSVVRGDPPLRVMWTKNGYPVPLETDVTLQNFDDSAILVFKRVTFKDSGNYTCIATNGASSVNRTTLLVVNVPPRWVIEPSNSYVILGQRASMDCLADGFPNPRMYWKKAKGKQPADFLDVLSSYRRQVFDNGTLAIQETKESDSGHYLCQSSNGVGSSLSKVVYLTVQTPPRFEMKFSSHTVAKGRDGQLKCEAIGDPPMVVKWEKDKQLLDPNSDNRYTLKEDASPNKVSSQLLITATSRMDSALYTCIMTNQFGSDETNIQLVVQEPPAPVTDVVVSESTSRSVTLGWNPSFSGNSPITKFIVQYKNQTASWEEDTAEVIVSGTENSQVIRVLVPASSYNFRIMATNTLGDSEPSDVLTTTTDEEVPGGPPIDVGVHPTGSQSLKVTWKPPKKELQYGTIQGYYIGYKVAGTEDPFQYKNIEATPRSGDDTEMSYLTNLKRLTKYIIIVQAYNNVGAGPRSDEVLSQTLEAAPPTSPLLEASSSTFDSITVRWDRQEDDTAVRDYVLHYKAEGGEWQQKKMTTSSDHYTLEGLMCGTRYRLYMTASNSLGTGEPSDPVTTRTKGAAPVSPQRDSFIIFNTTSVTLLLSKWQTGGCPISSFSVQYRSQFQREWKLVSDRVSSMQQTIDVRHLLPSREYALRVTAHSEAGTTEAEYTFQTLNISQSAPTSKPVMPPYLTADNAVPFYKNLTILLPVVISVSVLVIVIITVIVCLRRQTDSSSRGSNGDCQEWKGRHIDHVGLTEFSQKDVKDPDVYAKTSYYSSPSRKPHAVGSTCHRSHTEEKHEYAEPYTTVPAPRCTVDDGDCRTTLSVRMAISERQELCNNSSSSQSVASGGRPSSLSSEGYRPYRQGCVQETYR